MIKRSMTHHQCNIYKDSIESNQWKTHQRYGIKIATAIIADDVRTLHVARAISLTSIHECYGHGYDQVI